MLTGKGLTQLDVSQNQLLNVPSNAVKNLHNLLIFNLNHNRISVIHNRAFVGLDTLEILTLYENKVTNVEPDAFRGLEKYVWEGRVYYYCLCNILATAFNWTNPLCVGVIVIVHRKLKRLNLGGNELTAVPQKALSLLENLRKLEIQENKIRDIKEGDFEGGWHRHAQLLYRPGLQSDSLCVNFAFRLQVCATWTR